MASGRSLLPLLTRSTTQTLPKEPWASHPSPLDIVRPSTHHRSRSTKSTSALAQKAVHRRSPLPLPVLGTMPSYGAAAVVSSIRQASGIRHGLRLSQMDNAFPTYEVTRSSLCNKMSRGCARYIRYRSYLAIFLLVFMFLVLSPRLLCLRQQAKR